MYEVGLIGTILFLMGIAALIIFESWFILTEKVILVFEVEE